VLLRYFAVDILFDLEIERTTRANQKAVRLSKSVPPVPRTRYISPTPSEPESIISPKSNTMGDVDPPPRPKLGDYGLGTYIFMGPLGLVLKVLFFFFCSLCGFCSFKTLGLTPFDLESHEATIVFLL